MAAFESKLQGDHMQALGACLGQEDLAVSLLQVAAAWGQKLPQTCLGTSALSLLQTEEIVLDSWAGE